MAAIYLAPVQQSDGAELVAANIESLAYHQPWTTAFINETGFENWLKQSQTDNHVGLIARDAESKTIVGVINFSQIVGGIFQSAYIGYYGMLAHAGHGLMTEALTAAVQYAFTEIDLHRLEANIQPENTRSIALVQRVGFRKEGYSPNYLFLDGAWRDHERWAITREDFCS